MNSRLRSSIRSVLLTAGITASASVLAEPQSAETSEISEIIIVTGSYIRGTAEDAALPVDVLTSDDLTKQGSPSMPDLIKSIPAVQGVMGETNQFGAGQSTGSSNVNLRGLGATRTLVLLNGRRIASNPATGVGVDTNLLPLAAIGRIEVLKDGAAATYGSDAIGGVVNFITKDNLEGLLVDGSYSYVDGGDGDYGANLAWGWQGEGSSLLLAGGYRHRSEISTLERDWAVREITDNPQGGWSGFGNPGTYVNPVNGSRFVDPACGTLGVPTGVGTATPGCQFQYIVFDNIVEDEDHYQAYAKYDLDISDSVSFYAEALYAAHSVPEENSSPSYGPTQGATGGTPNYIIPATNPGIQNLIATGALAPVPALVASGLLWRPFANGGNPLTGEGKQDKRDFDSWRVSAGFNGTFSNEINWDTAVTYSETGSDIATPDMVVSRLALALGGRGGPNCDVAANTPGQNGCEWLNPFSSSYAGNPMTGVDNPYYVEGLENSRELVDWLFEDYAYESTNKLLVVDAVLSGEMGWQLPGGAVGWAMGAQYRDSNFVREVNDISDINVNPCAQTPITGTTACTEPGANPGPNGALAFFGPLADLDLEQDVFAVFGELNLPITDSFQTQFAVRYEDYGGNVGSTTNPKLAMRWQVFDALALRGSIGTTFRAPPETMLAQGYTTTLAFTSAVTGYRPYDNYGNPDLEPETADTFNFGFIVQAGGFNATVDYWKFKFEDSLDNEPGTSIVASVFPTGQPNRCADPAYAGLVARMTFTDGVCSAANLLRTRANNINGPDVDIAGIDASASFTFQAGPGDMTLGVDGTYNLEFDSEALLIEGIVIEQAGDRIGTRGTSSGTLPEWKAAAYINFGTDMHNVRWTTRYVDGVEDGITPSRASIFVTNPNGREVDEFITSDLSYRLSLPSDLTIGASVFNVFDEEPPFARLDLSYDPFIGNPLGRYYKVSIGKKF